MKKLSNFHYGLALGAASLLVLAIAATGCRPTFPQCRNNDDCKAEEGNSTLLVCVNGKCQECAVDEDCPKDRPHCNANRCVECLEDKDCPEGKFCKNNQCKWECEIDSDCTDGKVCKNHKCQIECEKDEDCSNPDLECKNQRCVPKCQCHSDLDCGSGMACRDCKCVDKSACRIESIYFDFDRYDIRSTDQSILDQNAACIKSRNLSVQIVGNCDERGTEEYNIALGDRRARGAKKYLQSLGIKDSQLSTISYGKNRPACNESTEDCWAKNRRDDFVEK
jgi:peptidoglycan-associated lipoprotein